MKIIKHQDKVYLIHLLQHNSKDKIHQETRQFSINHHFHKEYHKITKVIKLFISSI